MPRCTYCNANVSPNAEKCPRCGDNLKEMKAEIEADKEFWSAVSFYSFFYGTPLLGVLLIIFSFNMQSYWGGQVFCAGLGITGVFTQLLINSVRIAAIVNLLFAVFYFFAFMDGMYWTGLFLLYFGWSAYSHYVRHLESQKPPLSEEEEKKLWDELEAELMPEFEEAEKRRKNKM